jgi:ABC-type lipoprotein export system ATPase subunit
MNVRRPGSQRSSATAEELVSKDPGGNGSEVAVSARGVSKTYGSGVQRIEVLRDLDLDIPRGQMLAVIGPSGSGKSTLLHVLSGLDSLSAGEVVLNGRNLAELSERERAEWRARHIGFVLQQNNLIPSLTIEENVAAPLILAGEKRTPSLQRAREKLDEVGIADRARVWPAEASVGELQRAAVARACVGQPVLVFADEPTGALDADNRGIVLDLFRTITKGVGAAAVVVTHDPVVAAAGDRVVRISEGKIEENAG